MVFDGDPAHATNDDVNLDRGLVAADLAHFEKMAYAIASRGEPLIRPIDDKSICRLLADTDLSGGVPCYAGNHAERVSGEVLCPVSEVAKRLHDSFSGLAKITAAATARFFFETSCWSGGYRTYPTRVCCS